MYTPFKSHKRLISHPGILKIQHKHITYKFPHYISTHFIYMHFRRKFKEIDVNTNPVITWARQVLSALLKWLPSSEILEMPYLESSVTSMSGSRNWMSLRSSILVGVFYMWWLIVFCLSYRFNLYINKTNILYFKFCVCCSYLIQFKNQNQ